MDVLGGFSPLTYLWVFFMDPSEQASVQIMYVLIANCQ